MTLFRLYELEMYSEKTWLNLKDRERAESAQVVLHQEEIQLTEKIVEKGCYVTVEDSKIFNVFCAKFIWKCFLNFNSTLKLYQCKTKLYQYVAIIFYLYP